jgi:polyhydroxyalkanoate synthesis regulator phasin
MERPSMYETVDETEVVEEVTLESLTRKVNTLAENINRIYEVFERSITDKFMWQDKLNLEKDQAISAGFYNIGLSITGLNAKAETLVDHLVASGLDREEFKTTSLKRAQEQIKAQEAEIQKHIEAEQARQLAARAQ